VTPDPVVLSWSGGKDAAMTLRRLREEGTPVAALLSVVGETGHSHLNAVPEPLLRAQAEALGLPIHIVVAPDDPDGYTEAMRSVLQGPLAPYEELAFGDIRLEWLRVRREERLAEAGKRALFPLWGADTHALAREYLRVGLRAVVTVVDLDRDGPRLSAEWLGREVDQAFLDELPEGIDPCGEDGEYHSFLFDSPDFDRPVEFESTAKPREDANRLGLGPAPAGS